MAEALCIWRRFRSRAVIGLEALLLDTGDADFLPRGVAEESLVERRLRGPACGTSGSRRLWLPRVDLSTG